LCDRDHAEHVRLEHGAQSVVEVVPVSIPGLRVYCATTEDLRIGMKECHAVARTERRRSEWWAVALAEAITTFTRLEHQANAVPQT
jgi:hypothetical protein